MKFPDQKWLCVFMSSSKQWSFSQYAFLSDYLTDLKLHSTKNNLSKTVPGWGLNSQPPDHKSAALTTELARNLLEISEVSFVLFHAPLHMLDFVYF